jgi:hypothetical protein
MKSKALLWALLVAGCGSCPAAPAAAQPKACEAAPTPSASAAAPVSAAPAPAAPSAVEAPAAPSASAAPVAGLPGSLPEVVVENVGLHIGGGPNDDATKAPFKEALAARFGDFRRCYAKVEEPGKGGTFGVDLRIRRDGGQAKVEQPRTSMRGTAFRDCVIGVFSEVEFKKPPRGPTVISYSLRFTVGGK